MSKERISLKRTVYYDSESGHVCQCAGNFYKTCALRVANDLPCQEAILSITPIDRDTEVGEAVDPVVRSLDKALDGLKSGLKELHRKDLF